MITKANFETMMMPLFRQWIKKVGNGQGIYGAPGLSLSYLKYPQDLNTSTTTVMVFLRANTPKFSIRR